MYGEENIIIDYRNELNLTLSGHQENDTKMKQKKSWLIIRLFYSVWGGKIIWASLLYCCLFLNYDLI